MVTSAEVVTPAPISLAYPMPLAYPMRYVTSLKLSGCSPILPFLPEPSLKTLMVVASACRTLVAAASLLGAISVSSGQCHHGGTGIGLISSIGRPCENQWVFAHPSTPSHVGEFREASPALSNVWRIGWLVGRVVMAAMEL